MEEMSTFNDAVMASRPIQPCAHCGAQLGYTPKGLCLKCDGELGDGIALVSAAEPPGLTVKLANAIRSGKLSTRREGMSDLLRNLINQIEMGTYRDALGQDLKMNVHFIAAKKAVSTQ